MFYYAISLSNKQVDNILQRCNTFLKTYSIKKVTKCTMTLAKLGIRCETINVMLVGEHDIFVCSSKIRKRTSVLPVVETTLHVTPTKNSINHLTMCDNCDHLQWLLVLVVTYY